MRSIAGCAGLALLFSSIDVGAGPGSWTTTGPEGGEARAVVADALAAGTLIAATRGGVFRSTDGAANWSRFEGGLEFSFPYALEAASGASVAYLAPDAFRLYRSSAGAAWMPTALALPSGDVLLDVSLRGSSGAEILVLAQSGLYRSTDSGASFVALAAAGLPTGTDRIRVEVAASGRIYVAFVDVPAGATAQVWFSDDAGATFAPTAALPVPAGTVQVFDGDLETAASDSLRLYLQSDNHLFRSSDGGASWIECDSTPAGGGRIAIEAATPDHLWISGARGVHRSTTACASWTRLDSGLSADGARGAVTAAIALAPGFPADDRLWVATDHGGVFASADAGLTFAPANSGLVASHIRAIAMHPLDATRILLGYGDAFSPSPAIWRSSDGGVTWPRSNAGLRATQIRGLAIDPTTATMAGGAHVYAVGSSRPNDEAVSTLNTDGGIYKSIDGGATWSTIDNGLPTIGPGARFIGTVRSVVLDPRSCASPPPSGACSSGPLATIYATASGRVDFSTGNYLAARIWKSTNAGASWSASDAGLPTVAGSSPCFEPQIAVPLVIDGNDPDTLYVGVSVNPSVDPSCPPPTVANGIFKSTDSGATWVHSSTGLPRLGGAGSSHWNVLALALDPSDSSTVYAGAYEPGPDGGFRGRVFKSVDAGATWIESSVGIAGLDVRALLVDPADPDTVYAGLGGGLANPAGVYRSDDGGLTWNSFSIGLPADAATALALDPHDPARLLAGTPGGLWELTQVADADSDGASSATENAAPNGGDADGNGTPDAVESNVASFLGNTALAKGGAPQVTLKVEALAGNCARINNAHALAGGSLPADVRERGLAASSFDRGVLRFELPDCQRARVSVTFHGALHDDVDWVWRNYGPLDPGDAATMAWYGFAGARKLGGGKWELTLDAGARGNYRDSGSDILFVGAPGFVDVQIFGDRFD